MNILLLSQFFSTTRGGGEYLMSIIAKKLAEKNHNVWVITNKIINEEYETNEKIKIIFVSPTLEYKGGLPPGFSDNLRYTINAIKAGRSLIKKEKIDLIHSNNFAPAAAGSILSFFTSKPHITIIHDVFSLCGKNYWKKWGKQSDVSKINVYLAPFFEKLVMKLRLSCIHTVSAASKDDLIKFGAKKPIYVISNSVEVPTITSQNVNPLQFVYVGRLVFYKNLEVILKAIEIVRKSEPKIKLIIVGGGPHKKILEKLAKELDLIDNVDFKGYVSSTEKEKLISSSTALLFPSLCEGFGIVILEAFSQKKPALVSDVRPLSDIVSHEKTGYVIPAHDEKSWAEYILKIIKNPSETSEMGQNGLQLMTTKYSQDDMIEKVLKMYSDVTSSSKK